jgi:hypothetical protein
VAACERICAGYARAGFNLLSEFQTELKTDLHAALRKARRALTYGFMCPRSEYPEFLRILKATGWWTDGREAQEDYDAVIAELFDEDGCLRRSQTGAWLELMADDKDRYRSRDLLEDPVAVSLINEPEDGIGMGPRCCGVVLH